MMTNTISFILIQVLLSNTVVYFYDAHIHVDEVSLEKYFSQYGQVFRTIHLAESLPSKAGKNMDPANLLNKVKLINARFLTEILINGAFSSLFFFIFVFLIQLTEYSKYKVCLWMDSNRGPLVSEATALPSEPQPLPNLLKAFARRHDHLVQSSLLNNRIQNFNAKFALNYFFLFLCSPDCFLDILDSLAMFL